MRNQTRRYLWLVKNLLVSNMYTKSIESEVVNGKAYLALEEYTRQPVSSLASIALKSSWMDHTIVEKRLFAKDLRV